MEHRVSFRRGVPADLATFERRRETGRLLPALVLEAPEVLLRPGPMRAPSTTTSSSQSHRCPQTEISVFATPLRHPGREVDVGAVALDGDAAIMRPFEFVSPAMTPTMCPGGRRATHPRRHGSARAARRLGCPSPRSGCDGPAEASAGGPGSSLAPPFFLPPFPSRFWERSRHATASFSHCGGRRAGAAHRPVRSRRSRPRRRRGLRLLHELAHIARKGSASSLPSVPRSQALKRARRRALTCWSSAGARSIGARFARSMERMM